MTAIPTNHYLLNLAGLLLATGAGAYALDNDVRLVPQLAYGTAGFEPGFAVEWRAPGAHQLVVRPELLINEDGGLGAGGAILFDLTSSMSLPSRHGVAVGPRVVYHNADHYGWEADAMITWSVDLEAAGEPWRHSVGLLGALGLIEHNGHHDHDHGHDRHHNDEVDFAATVGVFYAYRL